MPQSIALSIALIDGLNRWPQSIRLPQIDGLIDGLESGNQGPERIALDVKIINALGQGHFRDTTDGPLVAASKYRDTACARNDVRARCAARGIRYEPVVFTTQGGCEKTSEALLSRITDAIARSEGRDAARVKADLLEMISMSIARSVARAVIRRRPKHRPASGAMLPDDLEEAACLELAEDD